MTIETSPNTPGSPNLGVAYAVRYEGRWWIMHYTPAGIIVRLYTSYPDKAATLGAMAILGYQAVKPPRETVGSETDHETGR